VPETEDYRELRDKVASLELATAENRHALANSRQILDVKLDKITGDITDLKNALKWAGGLIISLMLSFMAWAALQQYNANESQKKDLQEQVSLLKTQDQAAKERDMILKQIQAQQGGSIVRIDPDPTPRQ
jgi:hypothetical protein